MTTKTKMVTYLILALAGMVGTWYYNILFIQANDGFKLVQYITEGFATLPSSSFSIDLIVCAMVFFVWMINDAIKNQIKHWWIFIVLTFMIAFAFSYPLYLFYREYKKYKISQ